MKISRREVGVLDRKGRDAPRVVEAIRVDIDGVLSVEAWTYGATLVEVAVPDSAGRMENVCARLPDFAAYIDPIRNDFIGCVLGRFARCVRDGRFAIDGQRYQLDRNIGGHHFHGGSVGFDKFVWTPNVEVTTDGVALAFELVRPDGDQGYPGRLRALTRYRVSRGGTLAIEHEATTNAPTVIGLTSHAFWNLRGSGTIEDHCLSIGASRFIATAPDFIPLPGPPVGVAGTGFDFRAPRRIGDRPLDLCFALEGDGSVILEHPASGRTMRMTTRQPGLAVYTGDHLSMPRSGICLQTGAWPDAPNRDDFPSARLDPGKVYRHRTVYTFAAAP